MSESLSVWKFECLKIWMSESLSVWKSGCLKVWISEGLNIWKSESFQVWMFGRDFHILSLEDLTFHNFDFQNLKEVSHESFVSHHHLLEFEGCLARKLRFHILNCWNLKEASHESFVFTSSTVGIWRTSRTRASFSFHQLLEFERNLARKLRFHIFNCWRLKEI